MRFSFEFAGIKGPDWLQHLIISQSDGKPGLAAALSELCKSQDVAQVWSGEAAARHLLDDLRLVKGERERSVLAAFAVGGDAGMSFNQVSDALGISRIELRQITADLGSGGLVEDIGEDYLQVRPRVIRAILVRNVFYGGATSLPIELLLERARSPSSTASVMMSACQRGAMIDQSLLERLVRTGDTHSEWEHFAWVDERCANIVLDRYPTKVCHAAPGLLHHSPSRTLHALLDADSANDVRAGAVEHPRRRISEWLFPIDTAMDATIERRLILLSVLEERVNQEEVEDGRSFAWALGEVLSVTFDVMAPSPRNNREFLHKRGAAPHAIMKEIANLWPRVRELFHHVPNAAARHLFDQIESWCLPQRLSLVAQLSEATVDLVRDTGRQMVSDVLQMPCCDRAWRTWAASISEWAKLGLRVTVDKPFEALYADRDRADDWRENQKKRNSELQSLADDLLMLPMDDSLQFLMDIRAEAVRFGHRNPNGRLWVVYQHIAKNSESPQRWLEALVERDAPSEFLLPFLDLVSVEDPAAYQAVLKRLLAEPRYRTVAIRRVLCLSPPNEDLLANALAVDDETTLADHISLSSSGIPLPVMARLLEHPSQSVRAGAAIGEWNRDPNGAVRTELEPQWQVAVREVDSSHHELVEIFEHKPSLAFGWLESQIRSGNRRLSVFDQSLHAATRPLNEDERVQLLRQFTRESYCDDCFDLIMGEDVHLFAAWLDFQTDGYLRLRPLDRDVGPRWEQMAVLALDAGVSPKDLADHCTALSWGGNGPLSQQFVRRIPAYEALATHPDPRLRPAGKRGLSLMQACARRELERERREEVYAD